VNQRRDSHGREPLVSAGRRAPAELPRLYKPRGPRATKLWRLIDEHFDSFQQVYDERYQGKYGFWRPVIERSVAAFLKCGALEEGFAVSSQSLAVEKRRNSSVAATIFHTGPGFGAAGVDVVFSGILRSLATSATPRFCISSTC